MRRREEYTSSVVDMDRMTLYLRVSVAPMLKEAAATLSCGRGALINAVLAEFLEEYVKLEKLRDARKN